MESRWLVKVFDGYSTFERELVGTYGYAANVCAGYPPAYIWSIKPA